MKRIEVNEECRLLGRGAVQIFFSYLLTLVPHSRIFLP
jgi:hypothetical protein